MLYKQLLYVCSFMLLNTYLTGYELFFNNFTNKILIIASKKRAGIVEKYYQIVGPGKSVIQAWHDANCLESLQWAELNPNLPLKGGLALVDPNRGNQIPPDKQKTFDETFFSKTSGKGLYLWNNLKIVVIPNALYQETVKSATQLVKGFDQTVCQTISIGLLEARDKAFAVLNKSLTALENELKKQVQANAPAITIDTLKNKIAETRTKVETYIKTKANAAISKQECFFNLAQIAEAAGNIHGISICKNRQFMILDTGEKDPLTGKPLFIAETGEGE